MTAYAESLTLLNATDAQKQVSGCIGRQIHRSTFFRWVKFLGLEAPYSLAEIEALVLYGRVLSVVRDADKAKRKTVELLREKGL